MPSTPARKSARKSSSSRERTPNRLRIIGGRWRGRALNFPPVAAIRPSPDRVRETLFNWLQMDIHDARCLDLFAGSGALGIEALSRGASRVVFVDREPVIGKHLRETLLQFGVTEPEVATSDALQYLQGPPQAFDIVFLDPPFASDLLSQACAALARPGWLASQGALIYLEAPADVPLSFLPAGWTVHRSKRAGQVGYHLLRSQTR